MKKQEVHIIGAGFSGMTTAYYLSQSGKFDITVFEKDSRAGGMIQTVKHPTYIAEEAASSILLNDRMLELLTQIQAPFIKPLPTAKKRFFFFKKMTRWPLNIFETAFLIFKALTSAATGQFKKVSIDESLLAWLEKRIGIKGANLIASPALQGVYAAPASFLNAQLLLSVIRSKKGKKYQGIVSGAHGMSDIMKSLEAACLKNQVQFKLNTSYEMTSENSSAIKVLCTRSIDAAGLVQDSHPELANQLKSIDYTDIAAVTVDASSKPLAKQGFGCVVSKNEKLKCLGVLFNSDIFSGRISKSNETYIFGQEEAIRISTSAELKKELTTYRSQLFNLEPNQKNQISHVHTKFWAKGLPLYNQNLLRFQQNLTLPENIYLNGNYLKGIGLSYIVNHSYDLAQTIEKKFV